MKNGIKKLFNLLGYDIRKINPFPDVKRERPVGDMVSLLEDLKVRGLDCNTILDVGANRTGWSRMAKAIFSDAKFCLIEPQKELEQDLKSFCENTPGSTYFIAGAGAIRDKKYLSVWDDLQGSSFLPTESESLKAIGKQRVIDIIAIDDLLKEGEINIPELVKLDIQGYELEALKGAKLLFGKTEVFILEISLFAFDGLPGMPIFADVVSFMLERGYVAYDFPGFLRRPFDEALGQCDVCFVKADGFLRLSKRWE